MKNLLASCFIVFIVVKSSAQMALPYFNNFDAAADTVGWNHYALQGTDSWEWGRPYGSILYNYLTPNFAWNTNRTGDWVEFSTMALETPYFSFADTTKTYKFSFAFQMDATGYHGGYIEYSADSGATWLQLNGTAAQKHRWYNRTNNAALGNKDTWSYNYYFNGFKFSSHSLDTIKGEPSVKFRFVFGGSTNPAEGWVIDHFSITEDVPNMYALKSDTLSVSLECGTFGVSNMFIYNASNVSSFATKASYYLSADTILDATDYKYGSYGINGSFSYVATTTLPVLASNTAGLQYILIEVDADDDVAELDETDNICIQPIEFYTGQAMPLVSSFENGKDGWKTKGNRDWQFKPGHKHGLHGAHQSDSAWSIFNTGHYEKNYIASPPVDLSTQDSTVFAMWYRLQEDIVNYPYRTPVQYKLGCSTDPENIVDLTKSRENRWDFVAAFLPEEADTSKDVEIRIYNGNGYTGNCCFNGKDMVIDDVYIGPAKADLSIERNRQNRFGKSAGVQDSVRYMLVNSGLKNAPTTHTKFYWSTDDVLDASDVLLGTKTEVGLTDTSRSWRWFTFTKPTQNAGKFYIIYELDANQTVDEMREYNNVGALAFYQESAQTLPYLEDFENSAAGWRHNSTFGADDWQLASPSGSTITNAFSGTQAFLSRKNGKLTSMSTMHLYSPVFDFSANANPVVEFDMFLDGLTHCATCGTVQVNLSYSTDGGATWQIADTNNYSFNRWYYPMTHEAGTDRYGFTPNWSELMLDYWEPVFVTTRHFNGRTAKRNTHYNLDLGFLAGNPQVQFRFNLSTGPKDTALATVYEGALIDNFAVAESAIDLSVDEQKTLYVGSKATDVRFAYTIRNSGNYIADTSVSAYFLSTDNVLDAADLFLGTDTVGFVQPDLGVHVQAAHTIANNTMSNYSYLLIVVDADSSLAESTENNNIAAWPLGVDQANQFPYVQTFEDTVLNGWHSWSIFPWWNDFSPYRMRHHLAPAEVYYYNTRQNGTLFTDEAHYSNAIPEYYLTTPTFDFTAADSISITFDLLCTGAYGDDGGNMQVSTNGGKTWTLLTTALGDAYNWYNYPSLPDLHGGEAGWCKWPSSQYGPYPLDSVYFDLSAFRGLSNVQFRFQYRSSHTTWGTGTIQGFRLDNFAVHTYSPNYVAQNLGDTLVPNLAQSTMQVPYQFKNEGAIGGRASITEFYWSTDTILDAQDVLIHTENELSLAAGASVNKTLSMAYPTAGVQQTMYVLYALNAKKDVAEETREDNLGWFVINFPQLPNYVPLAVSGAIQATKYTAHFSLPISIKNAGFSAANLATSTSLYWSADSVLDASDQLVQTLQTAAILQGDTLLDSVNFVYPTPLTKPTYFVFVQADALAELNEIAEADNTVGQRIEFDYFQSIEETELENVNVFVANGKAIILVSGWAKSKSIDVQISNVAGQEIMHQSVNVANGKTILALPDYLPAGYYIFKLKLNTAVKSVKVPVLK